MLIIVILSSLVFLNLLIFAKFKRPIFAGLLVLFLMLLIAESWVYGLFIVQCLRGEGMCLIGNQAILDKLYKARLIYALYYSRSKENYFYVIDEELGYTVGKNKRLRSYTSNSSGLRGRKEYSPIPARDTLRVAVFGDSYVFCDDEKDSDTWPYILESSVGNLEVLNFGVSGYGSGQVYLHYLKDGIRFAPHIIIVNRALSCDRDVVDFAGLLNASMRRPDLYRVQFWIENDTLQHKTFNVFDLFDPAFRQKHIYDKLDFYKDNKLLSCRLTSISNIGLLLKSLYIKYQMSKIPKSKIPDLKELNFKILETFSKHAQENDSILLFLNFRPFDVLPEEWAKALGEDKEHIKFCYNPDLFHKYSGLLNPQEQDILNRSGHYNALGNQIVANAVLEILKSNKWKLRKKVFYYDQTSNSFLSQKIIPEELVSPKPEIKLEEDKPKEQKSRRFLF